MNMKKDTFLKNWHATQEQLKNGDVSLGLDFSRLFSISCEKENPRIPKKLKWTK